MTRTAADVRIVLGRKRRLPAILLCSALLPLTALSCRTPPTPAPRFREVVSWVISPADGYRDQRRTVTLEYTAPEALQESAGEQRQDGAAGRRESRVFDQIGKI